MRITRTESGRTEVKLIVLTRKGIDGHTFTGLPRRELELAHKPVDVTWQEIRGLDAAFGDFMNNPASAKLRIWEIRGELSAFKHDLLAGLPYVFWLKDDILKKVHGPFPYLQNAEVRIGSDRYLVQAGSLAVRGAAKVFELKHARAKSLYGPCKLVTGQKISLRRNPYTVIAKRLPPVVTDPRSLRPGADSPPLPPGRRTLWTPN